MGSRMFGMLGTVSVLLGFAAWASLALTLFGDGLDPDGWAVTLARGGAAFAVVGLCTGVIGVARRPTRLRSWIGLVLCIGWLGIFTGALWHFVP